MAKPVVIASLTFPSQKRAKEFFRDMRDRYDDGERLNDFDSVHLRDLIAIHHEADTKIGCGISHFTVETDDEFGTTRHFTIHRTDGSHTDVSFRSPIEGPNPRRDRLAALRRGVEDQILDFRTLSFSSDGTPQCPLIDVPITEDSYHIDHAPPKTLVRLVDDWLAQEGITLESVQITPPADNQIVNRMTDESQLRSWADFHRENAKLRLLSPLGNLSDAKLENG